MPYADPARKQAYNHQYYQQNQAAILAQKQEYLARNRTLINAKKRVHWARHKDAINAKRRLSNAQKTPEERQQRNAAARARYWKNRDVNTAKKRARWARTKETRNAYERMYRALHIEQTRARHRARRARRRLAPRNDLTAQQWEMITAHYGYRCVYCGQKTVRLTQDHLQPLSAGGPHTLTNVVPACQPCNARKGTGGVLRPIQPLML